MTTSCSRPTPGAVHGKQQERRRQALGGSSSSTTASASCGISVSRAMRTRRCTSRCPAGSWRSFFLRTVTGSPRPTRWPTAMFRSRSSRSCSSSSFSPDGFRARSGARRAADRTALGDHPRSAQGCSRRLADYPVCRRIVRAWDDAAHSGRRRRPEVHARRRGPSPQRQLVRPRSWGRPYTEFFPRRRSARPRAIEPRHDGHRECHAGGASLRHTWVAPAVRRRRPRAHASTKQECGRALPTGWELPRCRSGRRCHRIRNRPNRSAVRLTSH